ncbi:MAG: Ig-like domain-containing protein [Clostridiales bacterium]|nr:Ig-like domain-containing protein [Clostridiales bacterium]
MKSKRLSLLNVVMAFIIGSILTGTSITANAKELSGNNEIETGMNMDVYLDVMEESGIPVLNASAGMEVNLTSTCPVDVTAAKYDPRIYNRMTPVKNQGSYGLCWDFATQACAEQYLINMGKATNSIDLSEAYFAYYIWKNYVAPKGTTWDQFLADGYNAFHYKDHINQNNYLPIALESNYAYGNITSMSNLTEAQLENYCYKINKCYYVDYSVEKVDVVKSMIVNYGAVSASYYSSEYGFLSSFYNNVSQYSTEDYNYYAPGNYKSNHAVTIVGWDDDYPASNFSNTPPGNGAWLCKNSWGTGNYAGSGYFWLTYYNQDNIGDTYTAFSLVDKGASTVVNRTYELVYGKILDLSADYPTADLSKCKYEYEYIQKTSEGFKANAYGDTEIEVYDTDGFKLGTASIKIIGNTDSYTLTNEDLTFSYKRGDYPSSYTKVTAKLDGKSVNPTLTSSDTSVVDVRGSEFQIKGFGQATISAVYCDIYATNGLPVEKQFTITVNELCSNINLTVDDSILYVGGTKKIQAKTTPENVQLKYSSNAPSIVTVDSTGEVTAKGAGTATITAEAMDGSGTVSRIQIVVKNFLVSSYQLAYGKMLNLSADYPTADLSKCKTDDTYIQRTSNGFIAKAYGDTKIEVYDTDGYKLGIASVKIIGNIDSYTLGNADLTYENKGKLVPMPYTEVTAKLDGKSVTPTLTSSNTNVAHVQGSEFLIVGFGETTITAAYCDTYATNGVPVEKQFTITVKEICSNIKLTVDDEVLYVGKTKQIHAQTIPENVGLEYSSNASSIVTVDSTGKVTAIADGMATITVEATDGSGTVSFIPIVVEGLQIAAKEKNITMYTNSTYQIELSEYPASKKVEYLCQNLYQNNIVTVDQNGIIKSGVNPGTEIINIGYRENEAFVVKEQVVVNVIKNPADASATVNTPVLPQTPSSPQIPQSPQINEKDETDSRFQYVTLKGIYYELDLKTKTAKVYGTATNGKEYTIKDQISYNGTVCKVTEIGTNAFYGNKKLKKITIGKNIKVIGKNAFYNCSKLKTISIKSKKIVSVKKNAFKGTPKDSKMIIPKSKKKAYIKLLKNAKFKGSITT